MSHWQLECILRPQEKMTHLLISQGDGSMGQDDAHWKQCRDWGRWSPYARGLAAPSCTKIPEMSRWWLTLTSPPGMRHLKKQSRETVKPCHSSLCSCGQGIGFWNVSLWRCEECFEHIDLCFSHRGSTTSPSLHLAPSSSQASKGKCKSLI